MMNNQQQYWDTLHRKGNIDNYSKEPTSFALEVSTLLPKRAKILELGSGAGNDSIFFAKTGHHVVGIDFSNVAIQISQERAKHSNNVRFELLDISKPYPYKDAEFDLVYARLSLHYFTDNVTKKVFREIQRVLRSDGLLCFICKSTQDASYGKGDQIEKDMYELNGHFRHFFSQEYAKTCLHGIFEIERMETSNEEAYGRQSSFVTVIARAIK